MLVLRTPKGWTGPKEVDGKPVEGTWRAHQVPLDELATKPEHLGMLEQWMKSYKPEELFDEKGQLIADLAELAPKGERRMGANPHANGGVLLRDLKLPDFRTYAVDVPQPGTVTAEGTRIMGAFVRDVMKLNWDQRNFRVVGPDETASNRLTHLFDVTDRQFTGEILATPSGAFGGRMAASRSTPGCESQDFAEATRRPAFSSPIFCASPPTIGPAGSRNTQEGSKDSSRASPGFTN